MNSESPFKGILGLGKASTLYYLNEIHKRYQEEHNEFSTCPFLLYQIDFQKINPFLPDQFNILIPSLKHDLAQISRLGISNLLVPNITLHETLDQMELAVGIYHPVNLTSQELQEKNISKVYLFGTLYTMNSKYLKNKFSESNISLLNVAESDQKVIEDFRKDVYHEQQFSAQIVNFQNLIRKYSANHPVVIACTELSLFALKDNLHCIDMADLQIKAFLK